jgi:flavodoxin I
MKKALIIFGSTTGNTETMAEMIEDVLENNGIEAWIKNVTDADIGDLTADHDLLILGCPAYGDDEIELQEDFDEFYRKMTGIDLNGKKCAVFAPGDSSYEYFCGSVDMLEDKLIELGGDIAAAGLKIDGDPDGEREDIEAWSLSLANTIKS